MPFGLPTHLPKFVPFINNNVKAYQQDNPRGPKGKKQYHQSFHFNIARLTHEPHVFVNHVLPMNPRTCPTQAVSRKSVTSMRRQLSLRREVSLASITRDRILPLPNPSHRRKQLLSVSVSLLAQRPSRLQRQRLFVLAQSLCKARFLSLPKLLLLRSLLL